MERQTYFIGDFLSAHPLPRIKALIDLLRKKTDNLFCHRRYASTEPGRDPGALLFWKKLQAREKNYLAHTMMIAKKKDVLIWKEVEAAVEEKINLRLEK